MQRRSGSRLRVGGCSNGFRSSKRLLVGALLGIGRVNAGQAMQQAGVKAQDSSTVNVVKMGEPLQAHRVRVVEALLAETMRQHQTG
jgi:hypothetical protein